MYNLQSATHPVITNNSIGSIIFGTSNSLSNITVTINSSPLSGRKRSRSADNDEGEDDDSSLYPWLQGQSKGLEERHPE